MTTERTLHHNLLIPWLTQPTSHGGLGWSGPSTGGIVNNAIDPKRSILWADAFDFLRAGNSKNALAWAELVKYCRKQSGAGAAAMEAEGLLKDALLSRIDTATTILEVLRSGIVLTTDKTLRFTLWNRKPSAGDRTADIARNDYQKNILRTSAEVRVLTEPLAQSYPFGGRAGKKGVGANIRLDQGFHLNGLPYAYLELKGRGAGQSAYVQGRRQMAEDFVAVAVPALLQIQEAFERSEQTTWPGLRASRKRLPNDIKHKALAALPLWFGKTAWRATMDSGEILLAGSPWDWLCMVDATLVAQRAAHHKGAEFSWEEAYQKLVGDLMKTFARMPDVLLDDHALTNSAWPQVQAHLRGMLGVMGLDQEIRLFGHGVKKKDSGTVSTFELMTPRAPQRAAMGQILAKLEEFYAHEADPFWLENDLRARLNASMPGLSAQEIEDRVAERLRFRNGQEAYSMLIQGAAGLGKTNIAVWISLALHDMLETGADGRYTSTPMFDYIIVLTDRLDLRKNIAEEAELSNGSRGMVSEAKTVQELSDILAGKAPRGTGRIVVVNLQKFPSLREKIKQGLTTIKRSGGRIAFLIDEVHRSNQGKLNAQTQEAFLEDVSQLSAESSVGQKKNLIVGLTASPTDGILARFGRWQPGTGAGNPGCWTPHFAYGMDQAVEDGYVLDPLRGLMRLETTLDIDAVKTVATADSTGKEIADNVDLLEVYENPEWQKKVARQFARIFLTTTVKSCRDNHNANRVGRGKAMVTVPSVRAAIGMQAAIKEALLYCAKHADGMPWENYKDLAEDIAEERVFLLYSDPGKRATTAQRDDTGIDSGCGKYNPSVNGVTPTEEQIIDMFRCKQAKSDGNARNAIIVVVDKLLTGFDENTLHTLMIARNLSGVSLLQTMCRVNRTRPGKTDCLVIDASYDPDGGPGLGREAARVFQRYGGLTTSRLNGLTLLEQVQERRKALLKIPCVKATWIQWKKKSATDEERTQLLADITRQLERSGEAIKVRREIGGYLSQQRLADPIMNLDDADRDEVFLDFLRRVHNSLGAKAVDDKVPVQFTVKDVDVVAQPNNKTEPTKSRHERERESPEDRLAAEMDNDPGASQIFEHLHELQNLQEVKARRVAILRQFLADLAEGIEAVAKSNPDAAAERRSLLQHQLDPVEAMETFGRLVARVKLSRVPGGKRGGLWVDQTPERRDLVEWIKEPSRMDLAMMVWMRSSTARN